MPQQKKEKGFSLFLNLHAQLIIIIVLTVGVFSAIFVLYSIKMTRMTLYEQASAHGESLAQGIASACAIAASTGNFNTLQSFIDYVGRADNRIYGIEVFVAQTAVAVYSSIDQSTTRNDIKVMKKGQEFTAPIVVAHNDKSIALGSIRLVISVDRYYDFYVQRMNASLISAVILLSVIAALLYMMLHSFVVQPIVTLESGAHIIGEGNLDYKITLKRHDEIGRLADAFNVMTMKLKASKEEIEAWNRTLEKKVTERTEELRAANEHLQSTQFQLMQSSKMAAIGMLGASIAHELNNPLSGIIGYSQLLLSKASGIIQGAEERQMVEKYLTHIDRESQRCKGIVDNLLSYSKGSRTVLQRVNIAEVVEATLGIMEYQIKKWRIHIQTVLGDRTWFVMGNSDKLEQVCINFIANSHHAMPEGGSITITAREHMVHDQPAVALSFQDTGCGIPQESLGKLFDAFFSTKDDTHNLGLGLSISRQIIKEHNGEIQVESEVGRGATFTVLLPLV